MLMVIFFISWIALSIYAAQLAKKQGRSEGRFFFLSAVIFSPYLTIPYLLIVKNKKKDTKPNDKQENSSQKKK